MEASCDLRTTLKTFNRGSLPIVVELLTTCEIIDSRQEPPIDESKLN